MHSDLTTEAICPRCGWQTDDDVLAELGQCVECETADRDLWGEGVTNDERQGLR